MYLNAEQKYMALADRARDVLIYLREQGIEVSIEETGDKETKDRDEVKVDGDMGVVYILAK